MEREMERKNTWLKYGVLVMACVLQLLAFASFSAGMAEAGKTMVTKSGIQLIMFEQEGCHYCELWDANIGVSYDKTEEGKFAPLRKVDIHLDEDIANVKPVVFTPTFVLYKDGREVGRLTGYISDDFFWGMLAPLLKKHGFEPAS